MKRAEAETQYKAQGTTVQSLVRAVASKSLQKDYEGTGQGISSSDMYHRCVDLWHQVEGNVGGLVDINHELTQEGF